MTVISDKPIAAGQPSFPTAAGVFLGLGLGGFFDGILLHQLLQWHHMATGWYPATSIDALQFNTLLDGLFHSATYVFVVIGLILLWRSAHRRHLYWSTQGLVGSLLIGFGIFNTAESAINHHLLGLHHVNETVSPEYWPLWDAGFTASGIAMLAIGWLVLRQGKRESA